MKPQILQGHCPSRSGELPIKVLFESAPRTRASTDSMFDYPMISFLPSARRSTVAKSQAGGVVVVVDQFMKTMKKS